MSTLMLVTNPIKRKGKKKMAKRRSAAQKAATRRLVAFNKARKAGTKSVKRRAKRAVTVVKTAVRRSRRRVGSVVRRARRSNSVATSQGRGILGLAKQAGLGAIGSVAIDIIYAKLPIPASLKTGNTAPLVKAAVTIGIGLLASKFANKQLAHGATVGALTVQMASFLHGILPASLQGYTDINGIEFYTPAVNAGSDMGMYLSGNSGMGEYVSGNAYQNVDAIY